MASEPQEWRKAVYDAYRDAWLMLEKWRGKRPEDTRLDAYIEDLKEALLDMKRATIDDQPAVATECLDEVTVLVVQILRISMENE